MVPILGVMVVLAAFIIIFIVMWVAAHAPYWGKDRSRYNSTDDWTPAPDIQVKTPTLTCLTPYDRKIITAHLEAGETLEGFTRGFFDPARLQDWKFTGESGLSKLPLLIAATSQRILLFEVTLLTVHRTCFIPYDQLAYLQPPKPGVFGTSGRMRLGLKSGYEYQMKFLGPLFNDEGMRLEQSMAAYLRGVASRLESAAMRTAA